MIAKAFEAIRKTVQSGESGGRTQWSFLGRDVCVAAWKRLHGLGCLSKLSQKLSECKTNPNEIVLSSGFGFLI